MPQKAARGTSGDPAGAVPDSQSVFHRLFNREVEENLFWLAGTRWTGKLWPRLRRRLMPADLLSTDFLAIQSRGSTPPAESMEAENGMPHVASDEEISPTGPAPWNSQRADLHELKRRPLAHANATRTGSHHRDSVSGLNDADRLRAHRHPRSAPSLRDPSGNGTSLTEATGKVRLLLAPQRLDYTAQLLILMLACLAMRVNKTSCAATKLENCSLLR